MNNTDSFATVPTTVNVSVQTIKDLLDCSFEGGSPWLDRIKRVGVPRRSEGGPEYLCDVPFAEGGSVELTFENPTGPGVSKFSLTPETLASGLRIMAEKHPKHFGDVVQENMDADTGDVFVQCCVFGEMVFS